MKRSTKGRGSRDSKGKKKEIRNARGLRETLGDRGRAPSASADDLAEFLESRRKQRPGSEPEAGRPKSSETGSATRSGYFWSEQGSKPVPRGQADNRSSKFDERESEEREGDESETEVQKPSAVHVRNPSIQNMFRANDRLRTPPGQEHGAESERRRATRREADRDELTEKIQSDERASRSGRQGGKASKKSAKSARREKRSSETPIYFDQPQTKASQVARGPAQAVDRRVVEGVVKRHPDGFGFVIPDDHELPDVYVPRNFMTGVMTNDRVRVEVYSSRHADRVFGEVKDILSHAYTRVVGPYLPVDQTYGLILGEGKGWGTNLRIPSDQSMGAREGDLVAVEITTYPGPGTEFTGRVVEIIGDVEEPLNDVKRIIFAHNIPNQFSKEAVADARKYGKTVTEKESKGRVDLRDLPLITIDGATARDFDDAVYVEQSDDGFKLWVSIADVSHYVRPGTALDEEAFERGTSTYFPNFVVPMLPEELSNELCSLNPHVDRLCFTCEMDIDFQGHISSYKFYEAVMKSHARVTYGEAQEVIDGATPPKLQHVAENIRTAAGLAKVLMTKRFHEGSLDLEIPETQVVVDASGESTDIIKSERLFAHRLIEELMLAANISTARFLDESNIPGIYRIHEEPFEDSIQALQRFLFNFGGTRSMSGGKLQKKITRALD
ncbi:MAG: ribonuclease R, partial [Bdellovibrionaceae bacterium]|nr:ribonuclease R [Pseudobdellovibrionaceae bacterium]